MIFEMVALSGVHYIMMFSLPISAGERGMI